MDAESESLIPVALRGHSDYGEGLPCLRSKGGDCAGGSEVLIAHSLRADGFDASEDGTGRGTPLVAVPILEPGSRTGKSTDDPRAGFGVGEPGDPMYTLQGGRVHGVALPFDTTQVTSKLNRSNPKPGDPCHPLAAEGHPPAIAFSNQCGDESGHVTSTLKSGCHGALPMIAFSCKDHAADAGEIAPTLRSMGHDASHANAGGQVAVAFQSSQSGVREVDAHATLDSNNGSRRHNGVVQGMAVRRLTPRECERLQGFPDDYTLVPYRGKPAADGPRYKAIGNSMAVPVMRWIGQRITEVEAAC